MFARFADIIFGKINFLVAAFGRFRQVFLCFGDQSKWSLVALDSSLSYTIATVCKFSWTDLKLTSKV